MASRYIDNKKWADVVCGSMHLKTLKLEGCRVAWFQGLGVEGFRV